MSQTSIQKMLVGEGNKPNYSPLPKGQLLTVWCQFSEGGGLFLKEITNFLGAPNLRTFWTIENIQIEFALFIGADFQSKNEEEGLEPIKEMLPQKLSIELLIGGIPIGFFKLQFKQKRVVSTSKMVELASNKTYVLELTTPQTISKAEPIEIRILNESEKSPGGSNAPLTLVNPRVLLSLNTQFYAT